MPHSACEEARNIAVAESNAAIERSGALVRRCRRRAGVSRKRRTIAASCGAVEKFSACAVPGSTIRSPRGSASATSSTYRCELTRAAADDERRHLDAGQLGFDAVGESVANCRQRARRTAVGEIARKDRVEARGSRTPVRSQRQSHRVRGVWVERRSLEHEAVEPSGPAGDRLDGDVAAERVGDEGGGLKTGGVHPRQQRVGQTAHVQRLVRAVAQPEAGQVGCVDAKIASELERERHHVAARDDHPVQQDDIAPVRGHPVESNPRVHPQIADVRPRAFDRRLGAARAPRPRRRLDTRERGAQPRTGSPRQPACTAVPRAERPDLGADHGHMVR
jgi:hypothetical protein